MSESTVRPMWIWYPGDFEIFHSNQLHSRREDFGIYYPPMWMQYSPFPRLSFYKDAVLSEDKTVTVYSHSDGEIRLDGVRLPLNIPFTVQKGSHSLYVGLFDTLGLPAIFCEDPDFATGEGWKVSNGSVNLVKPGYDPAYDRKEDNPAVFKFCYDPLSFVERKPVPDGFLFDFGRETFARIQIKGADPAASFFVCYGESEEEAMDSEQAYTRQWVSGQTDYDLKTRAFRFVRITGPSVENLHVSALYEYLPIQDKASFACDDPMIQKIFEVCAYTFHLNSREFFLDGIKRDRWVWSGDAYQSYMTNFYLFFEPSLTKRTIRALVGKPPYEQHMNTINDYTMYQFLALWDYYFATADKDFVAEVWPRFKLWYRFILDRLDGDGQMVQRPGDWIFIDWSEIDKEGPLAAEQILLWKTHLTFARLGQLMEDQSEDVLAAETRASALKTLIEEKYWNEEKQAYIDTYASGRNHVTRHANIFAILYDFAGEERRNILMKSVLENDAVTQITTPYFKFFELCARCQMGDVTSAQQLIRDYWGGMLENGATSIWEQFDPKAVGREHYAMYGSEYGCSLCHAWGGGPIYLLGRYVLGVRPTEPGAGAFLVEPMPGIYREIHGTVPLKDGWVSVNLEDGILKVRTNKDGGQVRYHGNTYPLAKEQELIVR